MGKRTIVLTGSLILIFQIGCGSSRKKEVVAAASEPRATDSMRQQCLLAAPGVAFGESEWIYTEPFVDTKVSGLLFQDADYHVVSANAGDLGSVEGNQMCSTLNDANGQSFTFNSNNKKVAVTIKVTSAAKQVAYWNSNTDLKEPDKHCAPSNETRILSADVMVEYKANGKIQSKPSILFQMTSSGDHGSWGQTGCPKR